MLPLFTKLSPAVTDIAQMATIALEAGSTGLTLVNTMPGLLVDIESRKPELGFGSGGMSGSALLPIGVLATWKVYRATKAPIIGAGGIASATDAIQYLIAGATRVCGGHRGASRSSPAGASASRPGVVVRGARHQLGGRTQWHPGMARVTPIPIVALDVPTPIARSRSSGIWAIRATSTRSVESSSRRPVHPLWRRFAARGSRSFSTSSFTTSRIPFEPPPGRRRHTGPP